MSSLYEIVIFTAGVREYADWVLDNIDKHGFIRHRLYREHTIITQQEKERFNSFNINLNHHSSEFKSYRLDNLPIVVKDLSKIGRPLDKTIIVDNIADNFILQKDNGIFIKSWYDDPKDTELRDLVPLLKQIAELKVNDVRKSLRDYRDQMTRILFNK